MRTINYYSMKNAVEINQTLDSLPVAEEKNLETTDGQPVANFKAIKVTDNKGMTDFVNCPKRGYKLIQHKQAFRPIIEGLTQSGIHEFQFVISGDHKRAKLQLYTDTFGYEGVGLGFSAVNSFDGSQAISYGIQLLKGKKTVELVGYRQVCSNGMKVRVPLDEAEFVREETRLKVTTLLSENARIVHTESAEAKIQAIQYVTEALALLREPVEAMIRKAQGWTIEDEDKLKELILKHVGKRFFQRVHNAYQEESNDLWGLYNAITFVASHEPEIRDVVRERLLDNSADLLLKELTVEE